MMNIAAVATELDVLTAALEEPGADVALSLRQLAIVGAAAIGSYLGLSVEVPGSDPPLAVRALADGIDAGKADEVRASLRLVIPRAGDHQNRLAVTVVLYAGSPGAFVDLAADLAWLTARPPSDFALDEHLAVPPPTQPETALREASVINQAIGVLIGRGYTPQRADWQLDVQAALAGTDRRTAAHVILAALTATDGGGIYEDLGSP